MLCYCCLAKLYHGTIELKNHNAGVMVIRPALTLFDELLALMNDEALQVMEEKNNNEAKFKRIKSSLILG